MVDITLFEVHLDGAEFTANAPFSSDDADDADEADWEEFGPGEEDAGGSNPAGALVGLLVLVVVVVAIKKVLGGSEDE